MSSLYKKNKKFYLLLILPALLLYSFAMLAPLFGGTIPYSFLKWNLMKYFINGFVREKSFCGI